MRDTKLEGEILGRRLGRDSGASIQNISEYIERYREIEKCRDLSDRVFIPDYIDLYSVEDLDRM